MIEKDLLPALLHSDFLKCSQCLFQGWRITSCSLCLSSCLLWTVTRGWGVQHKAREAKACLPTTLQVCLVEGGSPVCFFPKCLQILRGGSSSLDLKGPLHVIFSIYENLCLESSVWIFSLPYLLYNKNVRVYSDCSWDTVISVTGVSVSVRDKPCIFRGIFIGKKPPQIQKHKRI